MATRESTLVQTRPFYEYCETPSPPAPSTQRDELSGQSRLGNRGHRLLSETLPLFTAVGDSFNKIGLLSPTIRAAGLPLNIFTLTELM